jgi:predicted anti-sigma-YlaC factor YlaD
VPTCREVSELVTDYLERALPYSARLGVRLHLFQCEMCRRYVDQMRKTVRLLARHEPAAPAPGTEDAIVAALRREAGPDGE